VSLRPRLLRRYSHHSPTWKEHLQHVRAVFQVLLDNSLALKQSKCSFGSREVAYLGHIIRDSGVAMDPSKIDAVLAWPTPTTVRALRGFLGLTGYYRKFIRDYGWHVLSPNCLNARHSLCRRMPRLRSRP
jgi:hypothetical protein